MMGNYLALRDFLISTILLRLLLKNQKPISKEVTQIEIHTYILIKIKNAVI